MGTALSLFCWERTMRNWDVDIDGVGFSGPDTVI